MKLEWLDYHNHKQILDKIDQLSVWKYILGYYPILGEFILNPLRVDNTKGSCYLEQRGERIILIDWASREHSGDDCISAYLKLYKRSWTQTCLDLFQLGKVDLPTSSYMILPGIKKEPQEIIPIYREWNVKDKEYWIKRGITKDQLTRQETLTLPIQGYTQIKDGKTSEYHFVEPAYCYHCNGRVKLYFPEREKFRFMGTQGRNDLWEIKRNDTLMISKSHKDMLVLENLVPFSLTHIQGEEWNHPDNHVIFGWESTYKEIIIFFDNDIAGQTGAKRLAEKFLYTPISIIWIDPKLGSKDIDELITHWSYNDTLNYLSELINDEK